MYSLYSRVIGSTVLNITSQVISYLLIVVTPTHCEAIVVSAKAFTICIFSDFVPLKRNVLGSYSNNAKCIRA